MILVATLILVVAAVALLVIGLVTSSAAAYLAAAAASAASVLILSKFLSVAREQTFVSNPPPQAEPDWGRSLAQATPEAPRQRTVQSVAIEGYEDLVASEILPTLERLTIPQLEEVIIRERNGLHREGIISRAEMLIDLTRASDVDIRERGTPGASPLRSRRRQQPVDLNAEQASVASSTRRQRSNDTSPTQEAKPDESGEDLQI